MVALAAFVAASCGFVTVNGERLSEVIRHGIDEGDIDISVTKGGSGDYITKNFPVGEFNVIESGICCDMTYTDGEPSLTVTCSDNVMKCVTAEVEDGVLKLAIKGATFKRIQKFDVVVSAPRLNGLRISGAGDFEAPRGIVTDSFDAVISGAGDMEIDGLQCDGPVNIFVSGAGDVDLEGVDCESLSVKISGAGDLDLERVDCKSLKVGISGAGDCSVDGHSEEAEFVVSGAGDVDIRGFSADNLTTSFNGVGKVHRN